MPVLTNFLSVQELTEEEVTLSESYISTIREYRSAIKHVNKAFDIHIWPKGKYEELKRQIPPHIEIIPSITKIGETMPKYEYELTCEGGK